jgi:uncharacterized OB-fold protein
MNEIEAANSGEVITDIVTLRYDYSLGEVAGRFMAGLKEGKILATRCSKSGLTYLPPRSYCERSFEKCDTWVAIAFVRLDGTESAIGNYVDGLDLSHSYDAALAKLAPGRRVRVEFAPEREGRITDFSFVCID